MAPVGSYVSAGVLVSKRSCRFFAGVKLDGCGIFVLEAH
jgi:hypothetical protein